MSRPEPSVGFARAGVARSLPSFLAQHYPHVSVERVLGFAQITPQLLADPNGLLDFKKWVELADLAAAECGDDGFGVRFANQIPWRDIGALAYVAFHSPTLGAALDNACRYLVLQQNIARAWVETGKTEAHVILEIDHPAIPCHAQNTEGTLALFARICREGLRNEAWAPREVRFAHRRPPSISPQTQLFGCHVSYEQPRDELVLAAADLRELMHGADPGLLPILLQHADACVAKLSLDDDFTRKVKRVVIASLSSGDVTVEHIARKLGSSPRTIQRRLQDHGLSFKEVVESARFSLAKRYLGDPSLSLTETAFLVGYSDLSAFSRAFRRWAGRSAIEFRREHSRPR